MKEVIIKLWRDYSIQIYVWTCVVFVVFILIFNFAWALRYEFEGIVTIHEIAQNHKGDWRIMFARTNGRSGAYVQEEIFKTYEGALSFAQKYDNRFIITK